MEKDWIDFSAEEIELLKMGFQQNDFTKNMTLNEENTIPVNQAKSYVFLKKLTRGFFKGNYKRLGFKRMPGNFSKDFPLNLITEKDAGFIAEEGMAILSDEEDKREAVQFFAEFFSEPLADATKAYCRNHNKSEEELTSEDYDNIFHRVATLANEYMSYAIQLGQQIPEIIESVHDAPAHEDYKDDYCTDATNFRNKWYHARVKIADMLSLEENQEEWEGHEPGVEDDNFSTTILNLFSKRLDDIDTTIVLMLMDGYTQMEIAQKLGYKNNGAVSKRLKRIREKWDEFVEEADID